mgnify:CR=1 FL=1
MKTLKITLLIVCGLLLGCQVGPQPIEYGTDGCYFCKMTIVDQLHAAEVVTQKGKIYKFDATECMINFMKEFDTSEIALYLSNDFSQAGTLIDATKATFLISENVPSPMGAFLSAFKQMEVAIALKSDKGGEIYTWSELIDHLK